MGSQFQHRLGFSSTYFQFPKISSKITTDRFDELAASVNRFPIGDINRAHRIERTLETKREKSISPSSPSVSTLLQIIEIDMQLWCKGKFPVDGTLIVMLE